jgi:hypothetical protein
MQASSSPADPQGSKTEEPAMMRADLLKFHLLQKFEVEPACHASKI